MGKQRRDKRIIRLANQLALLETEISLDRNVQDNMAKIENICASLSPDEMMEIDEYIITKHKIK